MAFNKKTEEDDTGSGSGSQGSHVQYHDWMRGEASEGFVSLEDKQKQKLAEHNSLHELNVKKQKDSLENLEKVKKGDISIQAHRGLGLGGGAGGAASPFKKHLLSDTVQFGSGIADKKVNPVPSESETLTNEGEKEELKEELQNRLANMPKFGAAPPKPSPF
jgi:hypothetical protein